MYERGNGVPRDATKAAGYIIGALMVRGAGRPADSSQSLPQIMVTDADQMGADTRRSIQRLLAERGLYDGPIDGSLGPATERALEALLGVDSR